MNKIKFVTNIGLNGYRSHSMVANNEIMRRQLMDKLILKNKQMFCSNESHKQTDDHTMSTDLEPNPRDRSQVITPEESIEYMRSAAFKDTYAHHKVWQLFRRNFKGQFSPLRARTTCVIENMIWTSNPCPICRDKYLILHYSNLDLLNHFINPYSGYVFENSILCLCSEQYEKLLVAITLAKDYGIFSFEIPLRKYDYKEYYKSQE